MRLKTTGTLESSAANVRGYHFTQLRCSNKVVPLIFVQENQSHVNPLISCSKISPSLFDQTIPNQGSPVSILDQINMSNPNPVTGMNRINSFPSVAFHGFKRFGGNRIGFSFPCSHMQPASGPPQYNQSVPTQLPVNHFDCQNYDKQPPEILQTPYEPDGLVLPGFSSVMKSELPSIQGREPASEGMPMGTPNEYMLLYQQNSGLLDAMIEELQAKGGHEAMSLEQKCGLDELVWSAPTPLPASKAIHSPAPGFRHNIGGMSYTAIANGYVELRFFAYVSMTHLAWEKLAILNIYLFHQEFMNLVNSLVAHGGNRMPYASPSS